MADAKYVDVFENNCVSIVTQTKSIKKTPLLLTIIIISFI